MQRMGQEVKKFQCDFVRVKDIENKILGKGGVKIEI